MQGKSRKGGGEWKRSDAIVTSEMANARFERYYRAQGIISDEEWPAFLERMQAPLPTTFRIAGSRQYVSLMKHSYPHGLTRGAWLYRTARILNELIQTTHTQHLAQVEFEGVAVAPPVQLSW